MKNNRVGFVDIAGFGDRLVRMNFLRQFEKRLGGCHVTYYASHCYDFLEFAEFVNEWKYFPNLHQDQVLQQAIDENDVAIDVRYSVRFYNKGMPIDKDQYKGKDCGKFICDWLPKSGEEGIEWFYDDEKYLREHLIETCGYVTRPFSLWLKCRKTKYAVIANGYSEHGETLTKTIPPDIIREMCFALQDHGITPVQVGRSTDQYVPVVGCVNLVGKTSLEKMIPILDKSMGAFCSEGGMAHLSSHLHKPTVVLFGPTDPVFWGYPRNLNLQSNSVCTHRPCWFKEEGWHLDCIAKKKGELPLVMGHPECMQFDKKKVVKQALEYWGLE